MADTIFIRDGKNNVSLNDMLAFLNKKTETDKFQEAVVAQMGQKYIKIVRKRNSSGSKHVWFFLDYDGNIYKAASWKAPAKGIRGDIFAENFGWGVYLDHYGSLLYKR